MHRSSVTSIDYPSKDGCIVNASSSGTLTICDASSRSSLDISLTEKYQSITNVARSQTRPHLVLTSYFTPLRDSLT